MDDKLITEFLSTQAQAVAKGFFEWEPDGLKITPKGKEEAYKQWMELDPISRFLFGWLVKAQVYNDKV